MVMAMIRVGTITGVVLLLSSCGASAGFFSFLEGGEAEKVVETKQQASSPWRAKLHETQLSEQQWQQILSGMEPQQQAALKEDTGKENQLLTREAVRNYLLSRARKDSLIQDPAVQRQLEQVLVESWLNRNTLPETDYPDQQMLEKAWKENQKQLRRRWLYLKFISPGMSKARQKSRSSHWRRFCWRTRISFQPWRNSTPNTRRVPKWVGVWG